MSTSTLLAQLRAVLQLTSTEIQVAESRVIQARTEAVRTELTQNASNGRDRAEAIESTLRDLGGLPDVVGPLVGRTLALFKTLAEQAQPFDEALLGDLALEHQLLSRSKYIKALATEASEPTAVALADRLITAHSATVEWLETVLAEDALGGPAALRRTPLQAAAGSAVKIVNAPATWSARGLDRALDAARTTPNRLTELLGRGAHAGDVAVKTLSASRDAALEAAEEVTRAEGAESVADAIHAAREAGGILEPEELPVDDYDSLNVSESVASIKDLTDPRDVRAVLAFEEANKNRHGVVSAAQTRLAAIAKDVISSGK
ncbi:ferritin-like domain-containing protein [Rhodococcus sp. G-MC3]|uniref:ferritin-like domain-containing protein n=1 Tax=Rhodococcus sp. G-MC3 TaxID=3046209 RepID=UPI0024B89A52|nr:ferritin-like domain-containing protein [Rhodococcus sp. G-MC3]MDJ0394157.1 ferritin-like domain-containing protein [Rhodococcus sp. G-MC3]